MTFLRATLKIEENIFKQVKRRALDEDKTLQQLISEALRSYLGAPVSQRKVTIEELTAYPLRVKGKIQRTSLYRDYLDKKFPPRR